MIMLEYGTRSCFLEGPCLACLLVVMFWIPKLLNHTVRFNTVDGQCQAKDVESGNLLSSKKIYYISWYFFGLKVIWKKCFGTIYYSIFLCDVCRIKRWFNNVFCE